MMNKTAAAGVAALVVASAWVAPAYFRHALRHHVRSYADVPVRITAPARIIEVWPQLLMGRYCRIVDLDGGAVDRGPCGHSGGGAAARLARK